MRRSGRRLPQTALAALAMVIASPAAARAPTPHGALAPPAGAFRVVRMADLYDQTHAGYKPDDPRLVGRAVSFARGAAKIDFGRGDCPAVSLRRAVLKPASAVAKVPGAPGPGEVQGALAGLGVEATRPAPTFILRCVAKGADAKPGEAWNDAVMFAAGRDRWVLVLTGEVGLVLDQPPSGAPRPSFSCAKAAAASERAICSDADLAAWDRSVGEAFRRAEAVGDPAAVASEQKAWLVERDRCGADKACLAKRLSERTDALMQGL